MGTGKVDSIHRKFRQDPTVSQNHVHTQLLCYSFNSTTKTLNFSLPTFLLWLSLSNSSLSESRIVQNILEIWEKCYTNKTNISILWLSIRCNKIICLCLYCLPHDSITWTTSSNQAEVLISENTLKNEEFFLLFPSPTMRSPRVCGNPICNVGQLTLRLDVLQAIRSTQVQLAA